MKQRPNYPRLYG